MTGVLGAPAPVRLRLPVLAGAAVALLAGLYAALLLLGLPLPQSSVERVHGPVMVFGFVGTVIALERAVALGTRWALLAPACSASGGLLLLLAGPGPVGEVLLAAASVVLLGVYRALWRRQASAALLAQVAGAGAWYAATLLWLGGFPVAETVPWLVVFVVATIAGERLELARVALRHRHAERLFLAALAVLVAGATAATLWPDTVLFGPALAAVVVWLVLFDVARFTVRGTGLPRYTAVGLLAGYAWLGVAALLWTGGVVEGRGYDAALHAVFLGFTMSMIFAHAPVILPAVLCRPLPYHRSLYGPLALLHLSLLVRLGVGDAFTVEAAWRWAGVANVAAVLGFLACAAVLSVRGRAVR